ncbi:MAG: single-stranded DNA-binding protein [Neisseriaceae bacterium]|nr:single-stranded DNA-binding protein [Neisseriaceae bacterium]
MSVNKVILIGRLGKDPEMRYTATNDAIARFSIATSEKYKDKQGNPIDKTEWHNIVMFGKLAEIAGQYLKKGSLIFVEGKIQSQKYKDKQGIERVSYEIICYEMKMLSSKDENAQNAQNAQPPSKQQATQQPVEPVDDVDDDIPF